MAITDYSTTPANNSTISGTDISEGCAPGGVNDAIRQLMADIATALAAGSFVATGGISAEKLATDAVETAKIKDANVTAAKLATDAVETAKIKDASVTAAKLATDAVETAKIKDASVTAAKIAANVVDVTKLAREGTAGYALLSGGANADPAYTELFGYGTSVVPSTAQSVSSGVTTKLNFGSEEFDDKSWHDNSLNNQRITVSETGRYLVNTTVCFNTVAAGEFTVMLYKNNSSTNYLARIAMPSGNSDRTVSLSAVMDLTASDYLEVACYQNTGSQIALFASRTRFQVIRIK